MKFALVLLAFVGFAAAASVPTKVHVAPVAVSAKAVGPQDLNDVLNEFLALIPADQLLAILLDFLANDPDVQNAFAYLASPEFHKIVNTMDAVPELVEFYKYLYANGVDIYTILNTVRELIGLPPLVPPTRQKSPRSVQDLLDALVAVLPVDEITALFEDKLANDAIFQELIERMRSDDFQVIVDTLTAMPEYDNLLQGLREQGVDVDTILQTLRDFFGW